MGQYNSYPVSTRRRSNQLAGIKDPGRIEFMLDGAQDVHADGALLGKAPEVGRPRGGDITPGQVRREYEDDAVRRGTGSARASRIARCARRRRRR